MAKLCREAQQGKLGTVIIPVAQSTGIFASSEPQKSPSPHLIYLRITSDMYVMARCIRLNLNFSFVTYSILSNTQMQYLPRLFRRSRHDESHSKATLLQTQPKMRISPTHSDAKEVSPGQALCQLCRSLTGCWHNLPFLFICLLPFAHYNLTG